jgi:DNA-directed RNA polymerase specialized sigma24 family protein
MNEFDRLLEKEIPRLRRYAFALTRNCREAIARPSRSGMDVDQRRQDIRQKPAACRV